MTDSVRYCSVCRTNSRDYNRLSFFRFPKDEKRFAEWRKILQCEKIAMHSAQYCYERYKVCALHFEDKAFAGFGKCRLKKDAKPSIHLVSNIKVECTEEPFEPDPLW
ncbi:uncharacterized protein LOC126888370 [Diabrotica virgifera virgifera]|uniref:Uncharacterized protein LOC114335954 n=1 Tax=Diabrotica virgifera virgifera TaxID=50390 RepID=A0A6P7GB47_DIAVI|nr:uncharacterized protein LOC126888370 [Diabrotica virgifera virgifera]